MSKVAFLQNIWTDNLGLMWISSVLKETGHTSEIFVYTGKRIPRDLKQLSPDIVGFSVTTGMHIWALQMAQLIKKELNCLIIFGGPHATFFPEMIRDSSVDLVCRGEGEYAMLELADRLDKKEEIRDIKNLWVKKNGLLFKNDLRPLIQNLDKLPFPDRSYYNKYKFLARRDMGFFIAGRGCPYSCTFCFNHSLKKMYAGKGRYVRHRSPQNVIAELKEVREKWGIKRVNFHDDTFILNKGWTKKFLGIYRREIELPFHCNLRADLVEEEIIRDLKKAGCQTVAFGIESGDEHIRNGVLDRRISQEEIERTAKWLKKYKIKFKTYNMLGLPGETLEDGYKTVELNRKIKADFPWCSVFNPYPRTKLGEKVKRDRLLGRNFKVDEISSLYFDRSVLRQKDINKLVNLQKFFYLVVKLPLIDPLVKNLIKLPANSFFTLIGLVINWYIHIFRLFQMRLSEALVLGILSVKSISFKD